MTAADAQAAAACWDSRGVGGAAEWEAGDGVGGRGGEGEEEEGERGRGWREGGSRGEEEEEGEEGGVPRGRGQPLP